MDLETANVNELGALARAREELSFLLNTCNPEIGLSGDRV